MTFFLAAAFQSLHDRVLRVRGGGWVVAAETQLVEREHLHDVLPGELPVVRGAVVVQDVKGHIQRVVGVIALAVQQEKRVDLLPGQPQSDGQLVDLALAAAAV